MKEIELKCIGCGILFKKPLKEYTRRIKLGITEFYCSILCGAKNSNKRNRYSSIIKKCLFCKKDFISSTKIKSRKCCSRICSAKYSSSFNNYSLIKSKEYKKIASERSKKLWLNKDYADKVIKNSKKRFTSKGEEEIRDYIINKYKSDGWTFGIKKINGELSLIRDLYSDKLKVCFEYDGIWHFKDIHGQLKEKQEKDILLENWCKNNRYRLIRIKEDVYKQNKSEWLSKIENEIYNGKDQLVKFY